ncbi:hypothetical protein IAU59_000072 [Kwoniella sp. CBS 9459]
MVRNDAESACTSATTPLIKTGPQLEIRCASLTRGEGSSIPVLFREYRVYNYRKVQTSGRVVRGDGWSVLDATVLAGLLWAAWKWETSELLREVWSTRHVEWTSDMFVLVSGAVFAALYIKSKCTVVLYESVTPIPEIGIQLSVARGLSFPSPASPKTPEHRILIPLSTSHTLIPLSEISTVILNQGLSRFRVQYHLGVVNKGGRGIVVALDATRPGFDVLKEVYHGVREIMFDEFAHDRKPEGRHERVA